MSDLIEKPSDWPIVGIDSNERFDHSSGEPLPVTYGESEYRRGWTDGRLGVPVPHTQDVYQYRAERWCAAYRLAVAQKLERAQAVARGAEERAARARAESERFRSLFAAVERDRLDSPASYSWPLGVLYCVVAAILWIADLPLSLLAADGLNIKTNYAQLANLDLIRLNWTSLWEPLAFSIGIAALGLFFKFVADFFFKPKYQRSVFMKVVSTVMVVGLIALVTWNLYYLAQLRTGIKTLQEARRAAATGATVNVDAVTAKMQEQAAMSFILLTLTLPIIGGICASVGWSRIQNTNRYRVLRRTCQDLDAIADRLGDDRRAAEALVASIREERTDARELRPVDVALAAHSLYEQGFIRGRLVPETLHNGRRLHERAQFALRRFLGISERRVTETVSNTGEPVPQS